MFFRMLARFNGSKSSATNDRPDTRSVELMLKVSLLYPDFLRLFALENQKLADSQHVNPGLQEAADGVVGAANDWFPAHIERGVYEYRAACDFVEALYESVEARISLLIHGLHASAIVDM